MIVPLSPTATSLVARTESPAQVRDDSVNVIDHYGVAPAAIASSFIAAVFTEISTDAVSPATSVARAQAASDGIGRFIDCLA